MPLVAEAAPAVLTLDRCFGDISPCGGILASASESLPGSTMWGIKNGSLLNRKFDSDTDAENSRSS